LVLDDGTYWVLYALVGNSSQIAGVVQGTGTSQNGTFSSSNGKDFNFEGAGVLSITFSADYVAKRTFTATIRYSGTTVSLPATYSAEYELTPSLSISAGTYSGYAVTNGGAEAVTVTISATGAVTGRSASGCTFSGTTAPRSKGNVYNVSVTFAGGPCANGTDTVTGIGYWDAGSGTLYSAALNPSRSNGFLLVANKTSNDPSGSIITAFTATILANEEAAFEADARAITNSGCLCGNTVRAVMDNLLVHVQGSFDQQVTQITALSTQQGLRRDTVIPLVTKLGDDWNAYMIVYMTDLFTRYGIGPPSQPELIAQLAAGIAQSRDSAIATLDSRIVWVF